MGTDRVPPSNLQAEESLLGAMLLSREAIRIGAERLAADDFYKPAHGHIFAAIITLYAIGEPCDPVTVAEALNRAGVLDTIGGPALLINLQAGTPATSNAGRYAKIIEEHSMLRRLISVAGEIAEIGYELPDDVPRALEYAQSILNGLVNSGVRVGKVPEDVYVLDDFLDRPDIEHPPWCVEGLIRVGWRVMIVAGEGVGKMLRLDEPVPTPSGWSTIGELQVGDELFDLRGSVCRVTGLSQIDPSPETYVVKFSDGTEIEACADHLWMTNTYRDRQPNRRGDGPPSTWPMRARTTKEILNTLKVRDGHTVNHAIPVAGALDLPEANLPIDPYVLGVWLGDGTSRQAAVTLNDDDADEILGELVLRGMSPRLRQSSVMADNHSKTYGLLGFDSDLRATNLVQNKHIPESYLRASEAQRLDLLHGLMDTDGYCPSMAEGGRGGGSTTCELTFTCEPLARGAVALVRTLGMAASITESDAKIYGRVVSRRWRIQFVPNREVFSIERKRTRQILPIKTYRSQMRYITAIEPCPPSPMRCLRVDSSDHTFLVSENLVPTHNTVALRLIGMAAAQGIHPFHHTPMTPCRVLIVDLENPDESILDVCNPIREQALNASEDYDPERAWLWHRPSGINLRNRADRMAFEAVLQHVSPDLVCIGPLYKMYEVGSRDNDEQAARETMACLDDFRARYKFGLLMEHHAPKESGGGTRKMMPYGSSLWLRWPEIGISLNPESSEEGNFDVMKLGRWRGDRLENAWPDRIRRGGKWMWSGEYNVDPRTFGRGPSASLSGLEPEDDDFVPPTYRYRDDDDDDDDDFPSSTPF